MREQMKTKALSKLGAREEHIATWLQELSCKRKEIWPKAKRQSSSWRTAEGRYPFS